MTVSVRPGDKPMTVLLKAETLEWLAHRAAAHSRARCREAEVILETERKRESRLTSPGVLHAQGGEQ